MNDRHVSGSWDVVDLLAEIADVGRDPVRGGYSRHLFEPAELELRAWFTRRAQALGLTVEPDRNGNIWAHWGEPGPGTVATGYARDGDTRGFLAFGVKVIKPFILTPARGAVTSVYLASAPAVEGVTGRYFVKCRAKEPSAAARDEAAAARLWSVSEQLVDPAAASSTAVEGD